MRADGGDRAELRVGPNPFWWIGIDADAGDTPIPPWSLFFDDVTVDATTT